MTIDEARAHQQYDDCMFCPGFLTGPHMNSKCYLDWIEKKAQQILENSKTWQEPIIIGLAIAVIIGIGIVCLMDALKNKLK